MRFRYVMRYYHPFPEAIPLSEAGSSRVTHPSATKKITEIIFSVRLACVRRAASVRPEPGSNSLVKLYIHSKCCLYRSCQLLTDLFVFFIVFSDALLNFKGLLYL